MLRYHERKGDQAQSIETLDKAIALNDTFYPALIEKSKMLIHAEKFEQAEQVANRATKISKGNFEADRLLMLIQSVNGSLNSKSFEELSQQLLDSENQNAFLLFETSCIFARLTTDKLDLEHIHKLIVKACDIDPSNCEYRVELAFQLRLLKRYNDSCAEYQFATNLDDENIDAYSGLMRCLILNNEIDTAKRQFEFFALTQGDELR